ncbi:MAG: hypothetical protein J6T13_01950, partial [Bacteroidales bacterium]|nr:hypothetical protein [Bacteroidales bacterium]
MKKICTILFLLLVLAFDVGAQNDMFRGRDFWVTSVQVAMTMMQPYSGFGDSPYIYRQGFQSDSVLLYIVGPTPCTGCVRNPITNFSRQFTVTPGNATVVKVPSEDIMVWLPDTMSCLPDTTSYLSSRFKSHAFSVQEKGVEVVTSEDVYVYLQTNCVDTFSWVSPHSDSKAFGDYSLCHPQHPGGGLLTMYSSTIKVPVPAARHGRCEYSQLLRKMPWAIHFLMFVATEDDTWLHYEIVNYADTPLYADSCQLQAGEVALVSVNDGFLENYEYVDVDNENGYLFVNARTNCKKVVCYISALRPSYRTFNPYVQERLVDGKDFIIRKFQNRRFNRDASLFPTIYDSATHSYCLNEMHGQNRKYPSGCSHSDSAYAHETMNVYIACSLSPSVGDFSHSGPIEIPYVYHRFSHPFFQNHYLWKDTAFVDWIRMDRCAINLPTVCFNKTYMNVNTFDYGTIQTEEHRMQKASNTFPFRFTDRMTTHWMCPTTRWNVRSPDFPIDTVYCDLTVYVHSDGLHGTTLNGQAVPASAFEPVPQTNQEYYCAQFAYYNDDVPDVIQIENPNGFCAYLDEFGFREFRGEFIYSVPQLNSAPTPDFLYLVYYHDNASWVDLLESPYSHSNLSTDDSATVYRCLADTLHLDVEYNPDS